MSTKSNAKVGRDAGLVENESSLFKNVKFIINRNDQSNLVILFRG